MVHRKGTLENFVSPFVSRTRVYKMSNPGAQIQFYFWYDEVRQA